MHSTSAGSYPGLPTEREHRSVKPRFPAQRALGRFGDDSITLPEIVAFDQRRGPDDVTSEHLAGRFYIGFVQGPLQHAGDGMGGNSQSERTDFQFGAEALSRPQTPRRGAHTIDPGICSDR